MRRFSTISNRLQRIKQSEFAFLQQANTPPTKNNRLGVLNAHKNGDYTVKPEKPTTSNTAAPIKTSRNDESMHVSSTVAMKLLMNAVRRRHFSYAEELFQKSPTLSQRPAAIRLLIKLYCEQFDFTTAKAVLLATLGKVGETGAARYITHVTYTSQNSADIEEVFNRTVKEFQTITPAFAANTLFGLRFLDDSAAFDRVYKTVSQFWEPSLKPPTLLVKVLDALLKEDWDLAKKLWLIAEGLSANSVTDWGIPKTRVWYMACRFFLVESPKLECVDHVLSIVQALKIEITPSFTALLVRHLTTLFPTMTPKQWIQYVEERSWGIDGTVAEIICCNSLKPKFGQTLGTNLQSYAIKQLINRGLEVGKHRIAEGHRFRPDLLNIRKATTGQEVLAVLKSMNKRGLRIPYDYFVESFQVIAQLQSTSNNNETDLNQLVAMIRSHGYPIHCAGTDLSMVELHSRSLKFDKPICQRLLGEYLVQYPLISHDLPHLTRMAVLMLNCGAYSEAAAIVDSMRAEQQHNAKFGASNHDNASLQVLASSMFKMRESLVPFLRGIVSDAPNIYFDGTFFRKIRRMLITNNEDLDVLEDLKKLSQRTLENTYREIDDVVSFAAETQRNR